MRSSPAQGGPSAFPVIFFRGVCMYAKISRILRFRSSPINWGIFAPQEIHCSSLKTAVSLHIFCTLANFHGYFYQLKKKARQIQTNQRTILWSEWRDSNSRPPAPKAGALPTAQHPDNIQLYLYSIPFFRVFVNRFIRQPACKKIPPGNPGGMQRFYK